jgi:hypothetical protein
MRRSGASAEDVGHASDGLTAAERLVFFIGVA